MTRITLSAASLMLAALFLAGCAAQPAAPTPTPEPAPSVSTVAPTVTPASELVAAKVALPAPLPMKFTAVLEPRTFEDLYEIVDRAAGYPADSTAPRYLLTHTRTSGHGTFGNNLIDADLEPGDVLTVDSVKYVVDEVRVVPKPKIGDSEIWRSIDPSALFIIACAWNDGASATSNLIITTHLEGSQNDTF